MSQPIEEGCRAVVVGSKYNDGKVVTVGKHVGTVGHLKDVWEVDAMIEYHSRKGNNGVSANHISERLLRRIDDDKDDVISWEDMEDIWVPDEIKELDIIT